MKSPSSKKAFTVATAPPFAGWVILIRASGAVQRCRLEKQGQPRKLFPTRETCARSTHVLVPASRKGILLARVNTARRPIRRRSGVFLSPNKAEGRHQDYTQYDQSITSRFQHFRVSFFIGFCAQRLVAAQSSS